MSELILRLFGEIKERHGNKSIGTFEIVSYDYKIIEKNIQPDRVFAQLTTKDLKGNVLISQQGVIAGINDPSQPLTFAIEVETNKKEIEYAGMMIFFNDKKKFRGRMFPGMESILVACAKEEETIERMNELLHARKKKMLKLVASFDSENTTIMISMYNQNARNLLKDYNKASDDDLSALL